MIGFVLVTHTDIGKEMLKTVAAIINEPLAIRSISVENDHPTTETQKRINDAIKSFSDKEGVLILVDLFGATPANLCKEFLVNGKVEMITGCNLPILLKAATTKFTQSLSQVAQFLKNYGMENIRVYSTDF